MSVVEPMHYVCTHDEARQLVESRTRYWISNCGCREGGSGCEQSRIDVCLYFNPGFDPTGSSYREVDRGFVDGVLAEADDKQLVARPFRDDEKRERTDGICFCCTDCCGYFVDDSEVCDKGRFIELTDVEACVHCGTCVPACRFSARSVDRGELTVDRDRCYGCGLCVDPCPVGCIQMVERDTQEA
jgi:ferredoxin